MSYYPPYVPYYQRRRLREQEAHENYRRNFMWLNPRTGRHENYPLPPAEQQHLLPPDVLEQVIHERVLLADLDRMEREEREARIARAKELSYQYKQRHVVPVKQLVEQGKKSSIYYFNNATPVFRMSTADILREFYIAATPQDRLDELRAELNRRSVHDPHGLALRWGIL